MTIQYSIITDYKTRLLLEKQSNSDKTGTFGENAYHQN